MRETEKSSIELGYNTVYSGLSVSHTLHISIKKGHTSLEVHDWERLILPFLIYSLLIVLYISFLTHSLIITKYTAKNPVYSRLPIQPEQQQQQKIIKKKKLTLLKSVILDITSRTGWNARTQALRCIFSVHCNISGSLAHEYSDYIWLVGSTS